VVASLDETGFPIRPGDFHSQNILITQGNHGPTISGVIDWDESEVQGTSFFAQPPLFIVDHPMWDEDDPLIKRNQVDQKTFLQLIKDAEARRLPENRGRLHTAYRESKGIYLCDQIINHGQPLETILWPQLIKWTEGDEESELDSESEEGDDDRSTGQSDEQHNQDANEASVYIIKNPVADANSPDEHRISESIREPSENGSSEGRTSAITQYLDRILTKGILKNHAGRLIVDFFAFEAAQKELGKDLLNNEMSRDEFVAVIQVHRHKLMANRVVRDWMADNDIV